MENKEPKITIITVCRNSEKFLAETINSIISQTYQNIEHIVIDGASTDSTLDIIKKYSAHIKNWISEADNGMYEAMNKGLDLASGDYILILNSDDLLANNNTIGDAVFLLGNDRPDYFYGNLIKFKEDKYRKVKLFPVTFKQLLFSTHLTFVPHPCFFISAKLNQLLGGYNSTYKNVSDYDYVLRALSEKRSRGRYLNMYISKFRLHEESTYITNAERIYKERMRVLTTYGYFNEPYFKRVFVYYSLWAYYKIINLGNYYKK